MKGAEARISKKWITFFSTLISRLSLDGFQFRFRRKVAKGHSSPTKVLGSLLKVHEGRSQGWRFVFVFFKVTSISKYTYDTHKGHHGRIKKGRIFLPRGPLPAKGSPEEIFSLALHATPLILRYTHTIRPFSASPGYMRFTRG